MAKLVYPITVQWKSHLGAWAAIRELLQNLLDVSDLHGDKIKAWQGQNGTIYIVNEGTPMTRADLPLGGGTKTLGGSRGRYCEGFKWSLAILRRLGCRMVIRTGDEIWVPEIEAQAQWGGSECLVLETRKGSHFKGVKIEIDGISKEAWQEAMSLIIDERIGTRMPAKTIKVDRNKVLVDPAYAGRLYVGGLFVCDLSKEYGSTFSYGFDFHPDAIELDSDRRLASPWTVRYSIARALEVALRSLPADEAYQIMQIDSFESKQIGELIDAGSPLLGKLIGHLEATHGEGAIPVASENDRARAATVGLKAIVVSPGLAAAIQQLRPLDAMIKTAAKGAKRNYDRSELTGEECEIIRRLESIGTKEGPLGARFPITIVDFWSDQTMGEHQGGVIRLARKLLCSDAISLSTYLHEIGHAISNAPDGSPIHVDAITDLTAEIILLGMV